jgi:hypothetical protein
MREFSIVFSYVIKYSENGEILKEVEALIILGDVA